MLPRNENDLISRATGLARRAQEHARLAELWSYGILETTPDPRLDELTMLAARLCDAPAAAIGLIDSDRLWFKARTGCSLSELPRSGSFCEEVLRTGAGISVSDTLSDGRFQDHELQVLPASARAYVAVPLRAPSDAIIGILLVVDRVPRAWSEREWEPLQALARQTVDQLEHSRTTAQLTGLWTQVDELQDALRRAQLASDRLRRSLLTDGICQELAGLLFLAEAASTRCADSATRAELDSIKRLTRDLLQRVSDVDETHVSLGYRGLRVALQSLAADIEDKRRIACSLRWVGTVGIRDHRHSYFLWRVATAAANHAAQTPGCTQIAIHVVLLRRRLLMKITYEGVAGTALAPIPSWVDPLTLLGAPLAATILVRARKPSGYCVRCRLDTPAHSTVVRRAVGLRRPS